MYGRKAIKRANTIYPTRDSSLTRQGNYLFIIWKGHSWPHFLCKDAQNDIREKILGFERQKKKRGYGFWVTINDEEKKIPLVGSDMSVGPRRAMDDNLVLLLLLNIFCIKSPTPPLGPLSLRKYTKYFE